MTGLPTITVKLDDGTGTFPFDISDRARITTSIGITRGRTDEQGEVTPAKLGLTLENTDGRFTLGSTVLASPSPIYNNQRIRVTFTVGATVSQRFTGRVENWPVEWIDGSDQYATTTVTASDQFAALGRRKLRSVVEQEILKLKPSLLYTLGEPASSTTAGDTSGNGGNALTPIGSGAAVVFGSAVGPGTDGLTAAEFAGGQRLQTEISFITSAGLGIYGAVLFFMRTTSSSTPVITLVSDSGNVIGLEVSAAGKLCVVSNGATVATSVKTVNDGEVHSVVWVPENGVGPIADGLHIDGVFDVANTVTARAQTLIVGGNQTSSFTGVLAHVCTDVGTPITAAQITDIATAGDTGFAGELADDRIERYAGYAGLTAADLNLAAGLTQIPHFECTGTSPVAAMQKVATAEQGLVFIAGDGKLTFQNRHHRALQVLPDWTITNEDIGPDTACTGDTQGLVNSASSSRAGGASQLYEDAASILRNEQYPDSFDELLVMTDEEAMQLGSWVVNTRSTPKPRLPSVTIDLMTQTQAFQEAWLAREISDRLRITPLPAQAPAIGDLVIEGWTETVTKDSWDVILNLTPFEFSSAWVLDSATYSVLDSTTRLAY